MCKEKQTWIPFLCLIVLLSACNSKQHPEVLVEFQRFDEAVFSKNINELVADYPAFTPFYLEKIIKVGQAGDSTTVAYFQEFKNTYKSPIYDSVRVVFRTMDSVEKQLALALGNYISYFPNDSIPKLYTHFSGFNESIITNGNIISISLENYLGKSNYYDQLGVYQYLREGMFPNKIPVDIMKMLLFQKVNPTNATDNLLSTMIYQGKVYYVLKELFPKKSLAFFLNYTPEQELWCEANEAMMWSYLVEHQHLFSSDYRTIRSYIDPAPFTKGFPTESPGQTGVWIGFQIVKDYMDNTQTNLTELLDNTDYSDILELSAYNPE
ncbi:uncharacterized protein YjaZ [Balneicella halophila]|uniref:Uncharacterized protein YjaZ n=1 Tax=Balneicella halophila TaxID=1537566 RepID=A0A7L4UTI0_BALHA|nr:hypothetical protein [Balneicella halophila]PVX52484.1 uncharacterized protein YjaZ [Balneicella halophila]